MTDRDEFTIGSERRLLFATAEGLGRGCKPPSVYRAEPWFGCRGEAPGSSDEPVTRLIVSKRGQSQASRSISL